MLKCKKGFEIEVLSSNAGFYIGTFDPEEGPNCRISEQYFKTREQAERRLANMSFTQRWCDENDFCHQGTGCCITND